MLYLERDQDTIFALATPPGHSGIAVIRVSGPQTLEFVSKNARFLKSPDKKIETHKAYFGNFRASESEEVIDEILLTYFAEGRSFTGQESIEISCHGSPVVISKISEELLLSGCRLAEKGEFTYRAFMNGRMDLVQAESVLSLIESKSSSSARMSTRQLQGELSKIFHQLEDDLTWVLAHMEAGIDFSTEDIDPYDPKELLAVTNRSLVKVKELLSSYRSGRVIQEGFKIALVGATNVGKSSLLNALTQKDHAIVTDIEGTTRDLVHAQISVEGVSVQLTDTAGLRETEDKVEKIGIEKTKNAIQESDLIFWVVDLSRSLEKTELEVLDFLEKENTVLILNKKDERKKSLSEFADLKASVASSIEVSAKTGEGLEQIQSVIQERVNDLLIEDSPVVSNARHFEKLQVVQAGIEKTNQLLGEDASPDFISFELQCSLLAVKELLGKTYDDQVMDRVFQEFCIGK